MTRIITAISGIAAMLGHMAVQFQAVGKMLTVLQGKYYPKLTKGRQTNNSFLDTTIPIPLSILSKKILDRSILTLFLDTVNNSNFTLSSLK